MSYSETVCTFFVCHNAPYTDGVLMPACNIVEVLACTRAQADQYWLPEDFYIAWPCFAGEADDRANIGGE